MVDSGGKWSAPPLLVRVLTLLNASVGVVSVYRGRRSTAGRARRGTSHLSILCQSQLLNFAMVNSFWQQKYLLDKQRQRTHWERQILYWWFLESVPRSNWQKPNIRTGICVSLLIEQPSQHIVVKLGLEDDGSDRDSIEVFPVSTAWQQREVQFDLDLHYRIIQRREVAGPAVLDVCVSLIQVVTIMCLEVEHFLQHRGECLNLCFDDDPMIHAQSCWWTVLCAGPSMRQGY